MKNYTKKDLNKILSERFSISERKDFIELMEDRGFEPYVLKVLEIVDTNPSANEIHWAINSDDYDAFYCGDEYWADDFFETEEEKDNAIKFSYEGNIYYAVDYDCLGDFENCYVVNL